MASKTEFAINLLKSEGIRMTPQRYAILEYLLGTHSHPTADDIFRELSPKYPSLSVATVYNNLKVFMDIGIIRGLTFGDASGRFDGDMSDHYHVKCIICGKIVDLPCSSMKEVEHRAAICTNYKVTGHRVEIYGQCPECQTDDKK